MEKFLEGLAGQRRAAMEFLFTHLPQSDLDCYDRRLLLSFVDHALALRETAPWCAALDEEIFYHYVLFPRVNDEDLSFHRGIFHDALWERICALPSARERVLTVNRWCHENASYEMQDERTASPLTVYRCGSGRCGEESAFLVSALRSVGIAARQVYVPRWAHCDDNHAWVEALCDGEWCFLGACEPEPVIDRGWFNAPASRAPLVHTRLFGEGSHPLHGEKLGTEGCVTWYNQTGRYAFTRRRTLRAEIDGQRAAGAIIQIQVLNEASFHTIATLHADARGEAQIALGDGDFHIFARCGSLICECHSGDDAEITLSLHPLSPCDSDWREVDFIAPIATPRNPAPLDAAQKQFRAAVLADGRTKRESRVASMFPSEEDNAPYAHLLSAARGNATEIRDFLLQDADPLRETMLRTLSEKDLRDVTADVLKSHLRSLSPRGELPEEIYNRYVLCPRIEIEPMTCWREDLLRLMTEDEKTVWRDDPQALWRDLFARNDHLCLRYYANLVHTGAAAFRSRQCSRRSINLLFTAILRTLGIPARLRPLDNEPEFYRGDAWHNAESTCSATLRLSADSRAAYRQNWTISRWTFGEWTLLHPETNRCSDGTLSISLPKGFYRLITSVRMPNGNQFAAMREIVLRDGEQKEVSLYFRSYELSDLLRCQQLPPMSAESLSGETVEDICRTDGRPSLLFWLEPGDEPTEHILNELLAAQEAMEALNVNLIFLVQNRESLAQRTIKAVLETCGGISVLLDDWAYDLEQTARHLTCDPDTPPLMVVCDREGRAVYATSGYSVGSVDLLRRIVEYIAQA